MLLASHWVAACAPKNTLKRSQAHKGYFELHLIVRFLHDRLMLWADIFLTQLTECSSSSRFFAILYPPVRLCSRRFDKRHECQKLLYQRIHDTTSYIRRGWKSHLCNSSTFSLNPRTLPPSILCNCSLRDDRAGFVLCALDSPICFGSRLFFC
jgi:hypothetical protein